MKSHSNPHQGANLLENITDYALWGGAEFFQAVLGCIWVGFMLAFIAFGLHYKKCYQMGVIEKDKSYLYS